MGWSGTLRSLKGSTTGCDQTVRQFWSSWGRVTRVLECIHSRGPSNWKTLFGFSKITLVLLCCNSDLVYDYEMYFEMYILIVLQQILARVFGVGASLY